MDAQTEKQIRLYEKDVRELEQALSHTEEKVDRLLRQLAGKRATLFRIRSRASLDRLLQEEEV